MTDLNQILERLVQRTADGELIWNPTVVDDQYRASVDNIRIVVRRSGQGHRFEIWDEQGQRVEALDYSTTTREQDRILGQLYTHARRSALKYDETIAKLAKALDL